MLPSPSLGTGAMWPGNQPCLGQCSTQLNSRAGREADAEWVQAQARVHTGTTGARALGFARWSYKAEVFLGGKRDVCL